MPAWSQKLLTHRHPILLPVGALPLHGAGPVCTPVCIASVTCLSGLRLKLNTFPYPASTTNPPSDTRNEKKNPNALIDRRRYYPSPSPAKRTYATRSSPVLPWVFWKDKTVPHRFSEFLGACETSRLPIVHTATPLPLAGDGWLTRSSGIREYSLRPRHTLQMRCASGRRRGFGTISRSR